MSVESTMSLWIGLGFIAATAIAYSVYAWLTVRRHRRMATPAFQARDEGEHAGTAERRAA